MPWGWGEAAPPKKDTATGEYLASGIFPGAQIFSDPALIKKLGVTGIRIMTRIMGMILLAIAVEFVVRGIIRSFALGG